MSKRLMLALRLAPLLGALVAISAQAAPPGAGSEHHSFDRGARGHFRGEFGHRFGFGYGWGYGGWGAYGGWGWWDPVQYYPYPYDPYYYPYYYPPYPAYAPPPPAAPQAPVQASGPPPQQFWYYCDNPQGYYPYVANCASAWRQVAPTPPSGNTITPKAKQ